jgi:hypothetical protein
MAVPPALANLSVFGWTLAAALNLPEATATRCVDVAEFWCGVGAIAGAASAAGYMVRKFDKFREGGIFVEEDLLSVKGFLSAVRCVLSLRVCGLLWLAPVCSSFVFMNSSNCRRTMGNPSGDKTYRPVIEGNLHASVAAFLFVLATLRGVRAVVENPAGSSIFRFPALSTVMTYFGTVSSICCRCVFARERRGQRWKKAYKLVGQPWVKHLAAACKCPGKLHCSLVHRIVCMNKVKVTGRKQQLRQSAAYPAAMGKFVVRIWKQHGNSFTVHSPHPSGQPMGWKRPSMATEQKPSWLQSRSHHGRKRPLGWKMPALEDTSVLCPTATPTPSWKQPHFQDDVGGQPSAWKRPSLEGSSSSSSFAWCAHPEHASVATSWKQPPF